VSLNKFYSTKEFELIHKSLKLYKCPYCKISGYLILHGYIKGYETASGNKVIKGRRIFCSNRNNKKGCGHTYSIYKKQYIPGFEIDIKTLSIIILNSSNLFKGWKENHTGISISSFYRIRNRFNRNIITIRTYLSNRYKPPLLKLNPLDLTLKQLNNLNKSIQNALAIYQQTFQVPIIQ